MIIDLLRQNKQIRALKRASSDSSLIYKLGEYYGIDINAYRHLLEWVEGDMLDYALLQEYTREVDTIIHAAAFVSFNPADHFPMKKVNVIGTRNLVNAALHNHVKNIAYISSVAALENALEGALTHENIPWLASAEDSGYAKSKYEAELEIWKGIAEGLKAYMVHPSVIIGPGLWNKGSGEFFSLINKGFPFYPGGVTGFVDVRDVSNILLKLMDKDICNEKFIVSAENLSYKEFFNLISQHLGVKPPKWEVKPWMGEIAWRLQKVLAWLSGSSPSITKETVRSGNRTTRFDNSKIGNRLNFKFIPIDQSIKENCKFYLKDKHGN